MMQAASSKKILCGILFFIVVAASVRAVTVSARVELSAGRKKSEGHQIEEHQVGHHKSEHPRLGEAVFWLTPIGATSLPAWPANLPRPRLTQRNKSFDPHLLVVPVGSVVEFPNRDPLFHNVFSLFEGKRFDLGLYEAGSMRTVRFDKPGISYIFCNIHAEMSAVVVALTTPYYGISNGLGEVVIPNVPSGRYTLHVWYETALPKGTDSETREVTISDNDTSLGVFQIPEAALTPAHKNKYGGEYDPPSPDNPAYNKNF